MGEVYVLDAVRTIFGRYGLAAICIGVGQGLAIVLEGC
jgi:acetyl-CoA acetyltransferase